MKYNAFRTKINKAFSLIEFSVVIAVVSVILGSGLSIFNEYSNLSNVEETRQKMETILKAIDNYYDSNGRLPCSAGNSSPSGLYYGIQASMCPVATKGILPVSTLGLHPSFMYDAWGNKIEYAIIANGSISSGNYLTLNTIGGTAISNVKLAVISHGANDSGAITGRGVSRKGTSSYNVSDTATDLTTGLETNSFDDIVYFLTKDQLIYDSYE